MKTTPSFPTNRLVSRRHFLTGTTAGVAGSLLSPSIGLAGGAQGRGGRGQDPGPALPPIHPPPAQFPGTGRYLYVTNDRGRRVDVFSNTTGEHSLLWSFPYADPGGRVGGVCADHATQRLFATQLSDGTVAAYDMLTGKIIWRVNTVEKYGLRQPDRLTITVDGKALFVPMNFSRETSGTAGGRITCSWCSMPQPARRSVKSRGPAGRTTPGQVRRAGTCTWAGGAIKPWWWPIRKRTRSSRPSARLIGRFVCSSPTPGSRTSIPCLPEPWGSASRTFAPGKCWRTCWSKYRRHEQSIGRPVRRAGAPAACHTETTRGVTASVCVQADQRRSGC